MPLREVSDQLRTKWRRRSEPMLSMTRQKHQEQLLETQQQERTSPPPLPPQVAKIVTQQQQQQQQQQPTRTSKKKKLSPNDYPPNPDSSVFGIGDYQFLSQLGEGKFSKVMLARHYLTGEQFAIKMIDKRVYDDRVMSRLVREINIMEALSHPNIVRLYETFETSCTLYLVMEYIAGINLDEHLKRIGGSMNEQDARLIFRQVVAAVDYCHRKWVVHRDLKAPNILLTKDNQVRLVDFGLSNRFGLQRLRTICGSMLYYSPEIINGKKYIGPEIDCWCLGICLFRMVAGFEAFAHAKTIGELRKDILSRNYPMPSHFSDGLKRTIQKCLSSDRRKRSSLCNALQHDPWLNDYGRLGDLFFDASNYHAAMYQFAVPSSMSADVISLEARLQERDQQQRQFLRDMEEEKRKGYQVRKTIIHHAYNDAFYYTGNGRREDRSLLEPVRVALYKDVCSVLNQMSLCPVSSLQLSSLKSPMTHLLRKWKRPDVSTHLQPSSLEQQKPVNANPRPAHLLSSSVSTTGNIGSRQCQQRHQHRQLDSGWRLLKSSSTLNISQLYQRTRDKTYYFTVQSNARAISSTTLLSVTSSDTAISDLDDHRAPTLTPIDQAQDEYELMLLVRSVCELLGITYLHESKAQLSCMLTLCNYKRERPLPQGTAAKQAIPRRSSLKQLFSSAAASASTPTLLKKVSFSNNSLHPESIFNCLDTQDNDQHQSGLNNNSYWWLRQLQRLTLPHSNVLQHQPPLHHAASAHNLRSSPHTDNADILFPLERQNGVNSSQQQQQQQQRYREVEIEEEQASKKPLPTTDGTALFSIEVYFVPSKQKDNTRLLALRFTKVSGSNKVYKLATGWVTSVLQSRQAKAD